MTHYNLEYVETRAKDKPITFIQVRYKGSRQWIKYKWRNRLIINWDNVVTCRLDFETPKVYMIDGDECIRPGFRI